MDSTLQRIVVIGTSCSGKSTFARAAALVLGSTHIELDAIHFGPNWTPLPQPEFRGRVERAISADKWTCCGNYMIVSDLTLARATAIVWLNYSFPLVFWRALKRTLRRVITRERLYSDNRETFWNTVFTAESILWWVIISHQRRKRRGRELFDGDAHPHLRRIELKSPREADAFLAALLHTFSK